MKEIEIISGGFAQQVDLLLAPAIKAGFPRLGTRIAEELKEEYKLHYYRQVVNAICNEKQGFHLPAEEVDRAMVERVFADMLSPYEQDHLTLWFRLKRWVANRWKSRLFYQENLPATFLMQLWIHVVRPLDHAE